MKRIIDLYLLFWKNNPQRKPLLLRGARQVGKTFAIRTLAKQFSDFVEINFESMPHLANVFETDLNPKRIIETLSTLLGRRIIPGQTLLFFDEIQIYPKAITALRYFFEELPELHVIAAGSLLDFALEAISVPVGRIQFCYMYPLSFIEFLKALNEDALIQEILTHTVDRPIAEPIHQKIFSYLKSYMAVGGMPEVVNYWITEKNIFTCVNAQHALTHTYQQDFEKYGKRFQIKYIDLLFKNIPRQLGQQFRFSKIPGEYRKRDLAPCLDLLIKANVANSIISSAGNGIPLGAETNLDKFKILFLDIALSQTMLGLDQRFWLTDYDNANFINKGAIAEAFVGQELLAYTRPDRIAQLYYWQKEKTGSQAEVDYLVQKQENIIPVEVKSGEGRSLKSLRLFLENHLHAAYGIRFSIHNYSVYEKIHSYPLYAVSTLAEDKEILFRFNE